MCPFRKRGGEWVGKLILENDSCLKAYKQNNAECGERAYKRQRLRKWHLLAVACVIMWTAPAQWLCWLTKLQLVPHRSCVCLY